MLGREVQDSLLAKAKHALVPPSTISSAIILDAILEGFSVHALIYSQFPTFLPTLVTKDAVVAAESSFIAQAGIESASLVSLSKFKIVFQGVATMHARAHDLTVGSRIASAVSWRPIRWAVTMLRLCRDAHA
jgi:hypothetical protein